MNIIKDWWLKIKGCRESVIQAEREVFIVILLLLTTSISYGLGRLSKIEQSRPPITIKSSVSDPESNPRAEGEKENAGEVVASKTGSKYHYPWCPGAQTIKKENQIWFETKEKAKASGLTLAKNCK